MGRIDVFHKMRTRDIRSAKTEQSCHKHSAKPATSKMKLFLLGLIITATSAFVPLQSTYNPIPSDLGKQKEVEITDYFKV
jgi:hypothetical protein